MNGNINFKSANENFNKMTNILDVIKSNKLLDNNSSEMLSNNFNDESNSQYSLDIVKKNLQSTIKILNEIDLWFPQNKYNYEEVFKKSAEPIIKALNSYLNALNKI